MTPERFAIKFDCIQLMNTISFYKICFLSIAFEIVIKHFTDDKQKQDAYICIKIKIFNTKTKKG